MIELLAALSLAAAAGMRVALPLLLIGVLYSDNLWANVPILSHIPPPIVLGVLVSWSLVELFISKEPLGFRVLQVVQMVFGPVVGAIAGMTIANTANLGGLETLLIGVVCGLLALVLNLVQVGLFYRLRNLPLWVLFLQDFLCVCLVLFAFDAPQQGGLIALLLLWLAIRSSTEWRRWYVKQASAENRQNPRRGKRSPD
ncbi:MAG TPA: DUF4126 domain-containing protein [Chroococcidiopsis sp.]